MADNFKARTVTEYLVVHCSASPEGRDDTIKTIDRWHRELGWQGVGYHYVIHRDGTVHNGRPEWAIGSHVSGYNAVSIGICYIGGLTADGTKAKDTRTPEQKAALVELLTLLRKTYPTAKIVGHRDFKGVKKDCPSFPAMKTYATI